MLRISEDHRQTLIANKDFIKENLPLFFLIPTILGGLQQVVQLVVISPALIRFFSLSQLITDGLFIILYFSIVVIIPLVIAKKIMFYTKKLSFSALTIITFLCIGLLLIILIINICYMKLFGLNPLLDFISQLFLFFICGCCLYIEYPNTIEKTYSTNLFMIIVLITMGIGLASFMFKKITDTIPIDNFIILEKKYESKGKIEILYFNDKYIFLKVNSEKKSDSKIHIEKLDVIF